MSLLIRKPGILTTVQDLGRTGSRRFGINPNGVMDTAAARLINIALGNDENVAVLEMHFPAAEIEFLDDTEYAIGGADLAFELNGTVIEPWRTYFAEKGSILTSAYRHFGNRSYLAVAGGIDADDWLDSSSTNLVAQVGGVEGRRLRSGDVIGCGSTTDPSHLSIGRSLLPRYSRFPTVRVVAGAEFELLTATAERALMTSTFKVTPQSDRMGYRLEGEPLHLLHKKEMLSSAVDFGTIQLLPEGQLILLMADHQTTGGYPRVAHVIRHDLPLAAQLGANDTISFHLISLNQAEQITEAYERDILFFKTGVKLKRFK